jgi:hypothetical protein
MDLCKREAWSLTLREEMELRKFEISALRRIFGPKRNDRRLVKAAS